MRMQVQSLTLLSAWGSGVAVSCGVGQRHGSDPVLLWLWCRPMATALICPLAREPPYAADAALKKQKNKKKKKKKKKGQARIPGEEKKKLNWVLKLNQS